MYTVTYIQGVWKTYTFLENVRKVYKPRLQRLNFYNLEQFKTGSFLFDPKTQHYLQPENLLF